RKVSSHRSCVLKSLAIPTLHAHKQQHFQIEGGINRLEKCNQDILDYVEEFRGFSKMVLSRLSGLNSYKTEVKDEVENLLTRVERAQRDIDYFGSVRDSKTCVEVDEDLVKQQLLEEAEEKRKLKVMLNASCDHMLAGVKSLKIVKKTGDKHGSWMKDPGKKHSKIYLLNGPVNNVIFEFANIMMFMESNHTLKARRVILPFPWEGTGHIIYQGFLFYHRHASSGKRTETDPYLSPQNLQVRQTGNYPVVMGSPMLEAIKED
uniref:Olfactomedin-like domain-containing protein n=1 Tax=Pavo cristatus TaxID=9049 RepID=A0A8C9G404_PAVCR